MLYWTKTTMWTQSLHRCRLLRQWPALNPPTFEGAWTKECASQLRKFIPRVRKILDSSTKSSRVWASIFLQGFTNMNYLSVADAISDEGSDVDSVSSSMPSLEIVDGAQFTNLRRGLNQGKCFPNPEIHSACTGNPVAPLVGQVELQGRRESHGLCQSNMDNRTVSNWVCSTRQVKSFGMRQPRHFVKTTAHYFCLVIDDFGPILSTVDGVYPFPRCKHELILRPFSAPTRQQAGQEIVRIGVDMYVVPNTYSIRFPTCTACCACVCVGNW